MTAAARRPERGFTLLEIMIVIVILALVASGLTLGLGAITRARLRSACRGTSPDGAWIRRLLEPKPPTDKKP